MPNQGIKGLLQDQDAFRLPIAQVMPSRFDRHIEGPSNEPITGPLSTRALSFLDLSDDLYTTDPLSGTTDPLLNTTDPLPSLHKHWMPVRQQRIYISLIFFAIGFSAITALAIAIIGWLSLDIATYIFIWPSIITWLVLGVLYPDYGKLALKGFIIGILACFFYDCMRFAAIGLGLWGDFIPKIGMWLLHTDKPDWVVGYIWRYVGDGGFMSVAFVMGYRLLQPKLDVRIAALAFGLAIWLCLIGTVLLAPHGEQMLFPLTPITFGLSLLGHIIYGLSIGFLYPIFVSEHVGTRQVSTSPSYQVVFKGRSLNRRRRDHTSEASSPLRQGLSETDTTERHLVSALLSGMLQAPEKASEKVPEKDMRAEQSPLILRTSSSRQALTGQFVKPGFVDSRYNPQQFHPDLVP